MTGETLDVRARWSEGLSLAEFAAAMTQHKALWEGVYRLARVPEWAREMVPPDAGLKLLVLTEDWCGDAVNTIPTLARLADDAPGLELRIIRRDEHPAVMDRYLTHGSRSIPIVIVLDEEFREVGHWGPRPRELQAWVMENRGTLPKAELYPQVRRWYARDRGETTLREVLEAAKLSERPAAAD